MKSALKNIARRVLLTEPFRRHFVERVPVEKWPRFYGRAHDIMVPSLHDPLPAPTAECGSNISIILRLLKSAAALPGDVAECGVYQGASLVAEALYLRQNGIAKELFGCDSFEGFDETVMAEIALGGSDDPHKRVGGFNDTSYALVRGKLERLGLDGRVRLLKGYFQQTLEQLADRRFCFVHLDCDLYDSYKYCLEFFYPRMVPGGIILFDEYNDPPWPGCNKAVDEFLDGRPERPVEIESENYLKYYIQKV